MNKKEKCKKCGRLIRTKNLRKNKLNGELWCRRCLKKYGENKFYIKKEKKVIRNFTITDEEKKYLAKNKGWKRVNESCKGLMLMEKINRKNKKQKTNELKKENENKKEINKKFLEGLK